MEVTVHSSKPVKPDYGDGADGPFSYFVPLSVFDKVSYDEYAGLAKALTEYREWAGRLGADAGGNRAIVLNDAGAWFVEATSDAELASSLMQLTTGDKLLSGPRHVVADGHAIWTFLFAWGQATRGVAISPVPVHDRTSLFTPRIEFDHRGNEFKSHGDNSGGTHAGDETLIHRNGAEIEGVGGRRPTVHHAGATRMCIAVDGRTRMSGPRVPPGYTGNVVLWAWPTTTAQELVDRPLRDTVELISREVARIDDAYFRSFIDFASSGEVEMEQLVPTTDSLELTLNPNVEVDSLLGIPFYEMDLGGSRPFFFLPGYSNVPVDGFMYIVQSFEGDGSVDAYVPLFGRTMETFKKCCYSSMPPMADEEGAY
ncbi:hypothetical protein VPH35_033320 [Triticum aestivum]